MVLLETIETAAPPVAWPYLTWVTQSWWLTGWHNTVLVPYASLLSWLPDPTCACTHSHTARTAGLKVINMWLHTHTQYSPTPVQITYTHVCTYNLLKVKAHDAKHGTKVWVLSEKAKNIWHVNWVCECEWVEENVSACETDMNYGGEQSSGRKPSWLSLPWNSSEVKKGEEEKRGTVTNYMHLYRNIRTRNHKKLKCSRREFGN